MEYYSNVKLVLPSWTTEEATAYLANVARVSHATSDWEGKKRNPKKDSELLKFLFVCGHWSVFEFIDFTFLIDCPIFVARQLMRYRHASYIERSLRYTRAKYEETECAPDSIDALYETAQKRAFETYQDLLDKGERQELARAVLPLGTQTQFLMKVNLRELFHIFDERLMLEAQRETRSVVKKMFNAVSDCLPELCQEWINHHLESEIDVDNRFIVDEEGGDANG